MGLKVEPAYIGQAGYDHPVELDRNLLEGVFTRSGGVRYGDFALSPGVGTRAVAVAPGRRFLLGAENAQQGGYFVWSDGIDTSLLAAAVGNPRIDTFILRVIDNQYGVISGSPRAQIDVVQGVAAALPTARPNSDFNVGGSFYVPGAWDRLGDVRVNVADTGSIPAGQFYNPHNYVRVNGHCIGNYTASTTGFGGFPTDPALGDTFDAVDIGCRFRWDGTVWKLMTPYRQVQKLTGTSALVTFSNIPSWLKRIKVSWAARSSSGGSIDSINFRVDGVSTASYYYNKLEVANATTGSSNLFSQTKAELGTVGGSGTTYGSGDIEIVGWDLASSITDRLNFRGYSNSYGIAGDSRAQWMAGIVTTPAPHSSLSFLLSTGSFVAGSEFILEGWD